MELFTGVLIVAASAIGSALGTFLIGYARSRGHKEGEIDAIGRNLDEVVRQLRATTAATEEVRAVMAGGLWVQQEKWKLKRDAYLTLLQSLNAFAEVYVEAKVLGGSADEQRQRFGALLAERQRLRPDAPRESQQALLVARLIMVPEAFEAVEANTRAFANLMNSNAPVDLEALFTVHRQTFDSLIAAARNDLDLGSTVPRHGA